MRPNVPPLVLGVALLATPAAHSQIDEALTTLRAAESVDADAVGIAGDKSPTYTAYEQLRDRASAARLLELSDDSSPVVRCYAVQALAEAHPGADLVAVLRRHLDDDEPVFTLQGCIRAEQKTGDVMFDLARSRLTHEQQLDLAEELLSSGSPLYERERALRMLRLRDRSYHRVRALAQAGDDAALIALVRYGVHKDLELLIARLRRPGSMRDTITALQAAEVSGAPELLPHLQALEARAHATLRSDNAARLRAWMAAIAAHDSEPAARFLERFAFSDAIPAGHRNGLWRTLQQVIVDRPSAVFGALAARLQEALRAVR